MLGGLVGLAFAISIPFIGPKLYDMTQDGRGAWLVIGGIILFGVILGSMGFEPGVSSDEYLH